MLHGWIGYRHQYGGTRVRLLVAHLPDHQPSRVVGTAAVWVAIPWLPGRPRCDAGGSARWCASVELVTLNSFVVYVAYNTEKILLGRFWGAAPLGLLHARLPTRNSTRSTTNRSSARRGIFGIVPNARRGPASAASVSEISSCYRFSRDSCSFRFRYFRKGNSSCRPRTEVDRSCSDLSLSRPNGFSVCARQSVLLASSSNRPGRTQP